LGVFRQSLFNKKRKLVEILSDAIKETVGITPELSTTGGTSDGRFIANVSDQVVEFGPLNATIHKINECIDMKDIEPLKNIYKLTLHKILT